MGGKQAVETVLRPLELAGVLQIIDLRSALLSVDSTECEYFRDLVHVNRHGMQRLTDLLLMQWD